MMANLTADSPTPNPSDINAVAVAIGIQPVSPEPSTPSVSVGMIADAVRLVDVAEAADTAEIQTLALEMQGDAMDADTSVAGHASPTEVCPGDAATTPPVPSETSGSTPPTESILAKLGITDLSRLDYAQLTQLTAEAAKAAMERRQDELKSLLEGCIEKADLLGVSEAKLTSRLKALYSHRGLHQGLGQAASSSKSATDKDGQKPVVGVTYRHPTNGSTWKKKQGAAKKEFLDLIQAGATWAELVDRSQAA